LSKGCPFLRADEYGLKEKGQPFDKLRVDGFVLGLAIPSPIF
jgi:hypothetical protein